MSLLSRVTRGAVWRLSASFKFYVPLLKPRNEAFWGEKGEPLARSTTFGVFERASTQRGATWLECRTTYRHGME